MIKLLTIFFILTFLTGLLNAIELKIISKSFEGNEKEGVSIFTGNVKISKGTDEMNASKVIIYTDKERSPYKYIAEGKVSFFITAENNSTYAGHAQKAIFLPNKGEYRFFKNVHLKQINERKEINGDEVVVNIKNGTATAKGAEREPVIMIFNIKEKKDAE